MTKVFIGGSRRASRLNAHVHERLDNIMARGFPIVIGDANGVDRAVQQYLHSKHYRNVEVFCSGESCRNNVGDWHTRHIPVGADKRGAQFHSAKDRIMAQEATVGLMMWDGKSVGTLLNLFRLLNLNKKAVIYTVQEKRFREFRRLIEWKKFLESQDVGLQRKIEQRTRAEPKQEDTQTPVSMAASPLILSDREAVKPRSFDV